MTKPEKPGGPAQGGQCHVPGNVVSGNPAPIPTGKWSAGSHGLPAESLKAHFDKHGAEVGAKDFDQYLRKAEGFSQNLRGATKSKVEGATPGVTRYKKAGKYIDLDSEGDIKCQFILYRLKEETK